MPDEIDALPEPAPDGSLNDGPSDEITQGPSDAMFEDVVGEGPDAEEVDGDSLSSQVQEMFEDAQSGFEEQAALQDGGRIDNSLPVDQHHLYPQTFHETLVDRGYTKEDLGIVVDIDSSFHRGIVHGNVSGPGGDWNAQIETFLTENPTAGKPEIDAKVNELAQSHDLDMSQAHQYGDWLTDASIPKQPADTTAPAPQEVASETPPEPPHEQKPAEQLGGGV